MAQSIKPIRFIIVDDDELDRLAVRSFSEGQKSLELAGEYSNAFDALSAIKAIQPQLIFLDIEMPEVSGLELLKTVRDLVPMSVFITSHSEFALDGFELSALDYILKPLTPERFQLCVNRVLEYWEMKEKSAAYDVLIEQDTLVIKQGHDKIRLPLHEVIYLEAMNDYTKVFTTGKSFISLGALSHFLAQMPTDYFRRIHRSYAVAANKITAIKKREVLCGSLVLPVGNTYRHLLEDLFS